MLLAALRRAGRWALLAVVLVAGSALATAAIFAIFAGPFILMEMLP
jgi:hypothetical protein